MGFVGKLYLLAFKRAPLRFCMTSETGVIANLKIPAFSGLVAENIFNLFNEKKILNRMAFYKLAITQASKVIQKRNGVRWKANE